MFFGNFNATVNDWLWLNEGHDVNVAGNLLPVGVSYRVGSNVRGRLDLGEPSTTSVSHIVTPSAVSAQILPTTSVKTLGRVLGKGVITAVRVEVTTVFNGGTNVLHVGHSAVNNAYANTIDLGVPGVPHIFPGHAKAGIGLGKRLTSGDRDVLASYIQSGAVASTGAALVTIYDEPTTPPAS
jgi:hypothetical protein